MILIPYSKMDNNFNDVGKIPTNYILAPFSVRWQNLVRKYLLYCYEDSQERPAVGSLNNQATIMYGFTNFYNTVKSGTIRQYYKYTDYPDSVMYLDLITLSEHLTQSSDQYKYRLKSNPPLFDENQPVSAYFDVITDLNSNEYTSNYCLSGIRPLLYAKSGSSYPRDTTQAQTTNSGGRSTQCDVGIAGYVTYGTSNYIIVGAYSCLHYAALGRGQEYLNFISSISDLNPVVVYTSDVPPDGTMKELLSGNISDVANRCRVGYNLDMLKTFYNELGYPWTIKGEEALNTPISDLSEYNPKVEGIVDVGDGTNTDISANATNGLLGPSKLTNFFMIYNPTDAELRQIAAKFWSQDPNDWDQFLKILADPADAIITFRRVPYVPSSNQSQTDPFYFTYGPGIQFKDCPTAIIQKQYEVFDYGNLEIAPQFENFMDYSPFTKLQLFIPFIGFVPLTPEDWMGNYLRLRYYIDNVSSAFNVQLVRNTPLKPDINQIMAVFTGQMGAELPVTSFTYREIIKTVVDTATTVASVGFSAYSAISRATGAAKADVEKTGDKLIETPIESKEFDSAVGDYRNAKQNYASLKKNQLLYPASQAASAASSKLGSLLNMNIDMARSGNISAEVGQFNYLEPYLIITRINPDIPDNYNSLFGKPCNKYLKLSSLTGYTVVDNIHLDGVTCTEKEKNIIDKLLKSGVIL